ncbi:MAG: superoxide dismutase [Rikenellaceae bacterium]|nr:superoxide dismutase [Rikenellaceae bacterium]
MFTLLLICNLLFMTTPTETPAATFTLIELPYEMSALAPNISEETLRYHHGKHLQTYVNNVNNLIADTRFVTMTLEDIERQADGPLYNNAAQVLNHNLYFLTLAPAAVAKHAPEGPLAAAIKRDFGSFDAMKVQLAKAATSLFGSGWVWLAENRNGNLVILSESNAGNPLRHGLTPLLGIDVWEHAYYIDYRNDRARSIDQLWDVIDWQVVEDRYGKH